MNRFKVVLAEAWRSITASISTTIAATMTVLIGMFLVGLLIALGTWAMSWSDNAKKELLVKVYLTDSASDQQVNAVRERLESDQQRVATVTFVSKEDALKIMEKKYPAARREPAGQSAAALLRGQAHEGRARGGDLTVAGPGCRPASAR